MSTCHGREQETFQTRQSGSKNQKGSCGGKYRRTDTQRYISFQFFFKLSLSNETNEIFPAKIARTLFNLGSENIQIVLEEDGTEVLDDDYLMFLENNTKLMILPSNNHWNPPIPAFDETDCPAGGTENSYNPVKILQKLVRSPGSIALLSEEELDVVSSFTSHQNIGIPQTEVEYLISACQRELEQKKKIKDALDLVDLYQRAKQQSDIHP